MSTPATPTDSERETCTFASSLVHRHMEFARALARGIHRKLPSWVDLNDLTQYAHLGLLEAANAFDPLRGATFRTFAYTRIRGAIFDGLREMGGRRRECSDRHPAEATKLPRFQSRETGADAVGEELAQRGEAALADPIAEFRGAVRKLAMVYLLSQLGDGDDHPIVDQTTDPAQVCETDNLREALHNAIAALPPIEQRLVTLHYVKGCSFTECANALGRHKSRISRLHNRALDLLRELLA